MSAACGCLQGINNPGHNIWSFLFFLQIVSMFCLLLWEKMQEMPVMPNLLLYKLLIIINTGCSVYFGCMWAPEILEPHCVITHRLSFLVTNFCLRAGAWVEVRNKSFKKEETRMDRHSIDGTCTKPHSVFSKARSARFMAKFTFCAAKISSL